MYKVNIKRNNVLTNVGQFESLEEANAWLLECKNNRSFGKPAGYYSEFELTKEEKKTATEIKESTEFIPYKQYLIPDQFQIETMDITEETNRQKKVQKGINRQSKGMQILACVFAINEAKDLSLEEFNNFLNDQKLQRIERLLINGSLKTAKILIESLDEKYFSLSEKQSILNELSDIG